MYRIDTDPIGHLSLFANNIPDVIDGLRTVANDSHTARTAWHFYYGSSSHRGLIWGNNRGSGVPLATPTDVDGWYVDIMEVGGRERVWVVYCPRPAVFFQLEFPDLLYLGKNDDTEVYNRRLLFVRESVVPDAATLQRLCQKVWNTETPFSVAANRPRSFGSNAFQVLNRRRSYLYTALVEVDLSAVKEMFTKTLVKLFGQKLADKILAKI